jgi:hypothetical protein
LDVGGADGETEEGLFFSGEVVFNLLNNLLLKFKQRFYLFPLG